MKNFFLIIAISAIYTSGTCQQNEKSDSLSVKKECLAWSGLILDIGFEGYTQKSAYFQRFPELNNWGSKGVAISYYFGLPLGCKFTLAPGFGLGLEGYHFSPSSTRLGTSGDSLLISTAALGIKSEKSKLALNYFDIPLEIRFQTGNSVRKTFRFALGGKVGFLYDSHTKIKYNKPTGDEVKEKQKDDFGLKGIRYGLITRIGYSYFNLFAYYSLSTLFRENKGPEVTPYLIGISISPNFFFNLKY